MSRISNALQKRAAEACSALGHELGLNDAQVAAFPVLAEFARFCRPPMPVLTIIQVELLLDGKKAPATTAVHDDKSKSFAHHLHDFYEHNLEHSLLSSHRRRTKKTRASLQDLEEKILTSYSHFCRALAQGRNTPAHERSKGQRMLHQYFPFPPDPVERGADIRPAVQKRGRHLH